MVVRASHKFNWITGLIETGRLAALIPGPGIRDQKDPLIKIPSLIEIPSLTETRNWEIIKQNRKVRLQSEMLK